MDEKGNLVELTQAGNHDDKGNVVEMPKNTSREEARTIRQGRRAILFRILMSSELGDEYRGDEEQLIFRLAKMAKVSAKLMESVFDSGGEVYLSDNSLSLLKTALRQAGLFKETDFNLDWLGARALEQIALEREKHMKYRPMGLPKYLQTGNEALEEELYLAFACNDQLEPKTLHQRQLVVIKGLLNIIHQLSDPAEAKNDGIV